MSPLKLVLLTAISLLLCVVSTDTHASDDDCNPDTEACFNDSLEAIIANNINDTIATAIVLGVVVYFIVDDVTDDPNYQARLINDFQRGNGLRVTSYENPVNVSLLSIRKSHPDFEQPAFLNSKYSSKPVNLNLIRVSYDW